MWLICHQNWNSQLAIQRVDVVNFVTYIVKDTSNASNDTTAMESSGSCWTSSLSMKLRWRSEWRRLTFPISWKPLDRLTIIWNPSIWYKVLHYGSCVKSRCLQQWHVEVKPHKYLKNSKENYCAGHFLPGIHSMLRRLFLCDCIPYTLTFKHSDEKTRSIIL